VLEKYRLIEQCRLCGSNGLIGYVDFGEVPLGNNLQESAKLARAAEAYPLVLNRCLSCGHFQLGHAIAPELLYATNYTYLSGIGASFVAHFKGYAAWVEQNCPLPSGGLVVDIGSNDGTCLNAFKQRGFAVCGIDPAALAAEIANKNGIPTLNAFFDDTAVKQIIERHGRPDFITSHNVLAHVDDLAAVFRNINALLKDDGYFAFEIGYFRDVLRTGCFDTIYHEHLDYHHAAPLARHLTALGFDLISLSTNSIQGGSLRLLLKKTGKGEISPAAQEFLADEKKSILYDENFLSGWKHRLESQIGTFRAILRQHADNGAKIVAYGAPTKAVLLMKMASLGEEDVAFVVEDNPHKVGRFMPRTATPVRPSSELATAKPDVIVIFAWNFAEDIVPLPDVRTISI
jgi:SAM-dependent methyltransferase